MTTAATSKRPAEQTTDTGGDKDDLTHLFCTCSEVSAYCGKVKPLNQWVDADRDAEHEICIVCHSLELAGKCPKCLKKSS